MVRKHGPNHSVSSAPLPDVFPDVRHHQTTEQSHVVLGKDCRQRPAIDVTPRSWLELLVEAVAARGIHDDDFAIVVGPHAIIVLARGGGVPNLLIRDVPEHVVQTLKLRAAGRRRSLQQEMLEILEQAAERPTPMTAAEIATAIRERLAETGCTFEDSTPLIRADRER